jgi:hypothetical protein
VHRFLHGSNNSREVLLVELFGQGPTLPSGRSNPVPGFQKLAERILMRAEVPEAVPSDHESDRKTEKPSNISTLLVNGFSVGALQITYLRYS